MFALFVCVSSLSSGLRSADASLTDGGQQGHMEQNHVKSSKSMDLGKSFTLLCDFAVCLLSVLSSQWKWRSITF